MKYEVWRYHKLIGEFNTLSEGIELLCRLFPQYYDEWIVCNAIVSIDYSTTSLDWIAVNHECCSVRVA